MEKTLTEQGIDYAVDLEPFRLMVLGIFSKHALLDAGLKTGIEEEL